MTRRIHFTSPIGLSASIRSLTNDVDRYQTRIDENTGRTSCTCPAAKFNPAVPCKHQLRLAKSYLRKFGRAS